jgi:ABC-type sugar transport system substrate-binding protein
MKKHLKLLCLVLVLVLMLPVVHMTAAGTGTTTALATQSSVTVNGGLVAFQAYNINGANYFKLRDIAQALSGTVKQFEVGYDAANNAVTLTTGKPYTPVGGELVVSSDTAAKAAALSEAKVTLNGSLIKMDAYLISGYNYFKLRDIGQVMDFGVTWNAEANRIDINTSIPYPTDTSEIGFYDKTVNYASKPRYKIVYMMSVTGALYDMFDSAFAAWAKKMNVIYSSFSAGGDNDLFLTTIEDYAAQGIDGFIFDADAAIYHRVAELTDDLGKPWMSAMGEALDANGNRAHPFVSFNNTDFGYQMANYTIEYAKKNWPNAKASEIGMISMDFSLSPQVHERTTGAQSVWNQQYSKTNFFIADGAESADLSIEGGYTLATKVFKANPGIKYWLVCAFYDDYALGAADAAATLGKQSSCVVIDCGGSALISQWDSGTTTCWKASVFAAQIIFAEPMFCGLYAMMDGQATPETLWPEWINKNAGEKFAFMNIPTYILTQDNYKEYLEWVDAYTGENLSDYPYNGTQYPARAIPPNY